MITPSGDASQEWYRRGVPHRWRLPFVARRPRPSEECRRSRCEGSAAPTALTRLVNAHAAAVLPGASVSVNAVMSRLEREPEDAARRPNGSGWADVGNLHVLEGRRRQAIAFLRAVGFRELARTSRGWVRRT
jgi:hypothetical protein